MSELSLPQDPDLGQLRRRARELQRAAAAGDAEALASIARHVPGVSAVPLHVAQLALARAYGFAGWPPLVRYVETVTRYRWDAAPAPAAEPGTDSFLRAACLTYADDSPERRGPASAALAEDPALATATVHVAAACGRPEALRGLSTAEANAEGGPYGWPPLMYLAYARVDPPGDPVAAATVLLDAGADPSAGCLWHGLPTPFTVLTGVLGEGERGPVAQPRHPLWWKLAALLLGRGADPNDGQGLYNRMFGRDTVHGNAHLRLLLDHGLGRGTGGPWRARLGDTAPTPAELVAGQLRWAVGHDLPERTRLLLSAGLELPADLPGALAADAVRLGHVRTASVLREFGAPAPAVDPVEAFLGAVLGGEVAAARATPAEVRDRARETSGWTIVWAAGQGNAPAVELLLELGFDVGARGRGDVPVPGTWETALHQAAHRGDAALVETLLAAGADREARDERFGGTPADWAEHSSHTALAARLRRP